MNIGENVQTLRFEIFFYICPLLKCAVIVGAVLCTSEQCFFPAWHCLILKIKEYPSLWQTFSSSSI